MLFNFIHIYLDIHWENSLVETEQALKHSERHSAAVLDVNLSEAVVTAVGVAVVESPHSLGAASVSPNQFVAVDLSTASHAP